jgi:hypothetical protein
MSGTTFNRIYFHDLALALWGRWDGNDISILIFSFLSPHYDYCYSYYILMGVYGYFMSSYCRHSFYYFLCLILIILFHSFLLQTKYLERLSLIFMS